MFKTSLIAAITLASTQAIEIRPWEYVSDREKVEFMRQGYNGDGTWLMAQTEYSDDGMHTCIHQCMHSLDLTSCIDQCEAQLL